MVSNAANDFNVRHPGMIISKKRCISLLKIKFHLLFLFFSKGLLISLVSRNLIMEFYKMSIARVSELLKILLLPVYLFNIYFKFRLFMYPFVRLSVSERIAKHKFVIFTNLLI